MDYPGRPSSGIAYNAGISQAEHDDPSYGQGAGDTESDLAPAWPARPPLSFSKIFSFRQFFPRTRGTTAWDMGARQRVSFTP
jgi:hypothetical protein